jgi:predicted nicotinamide N-methyase
LREKDGYSTIVGVYDLERALRGCGKDASKLRELFDTLKPEMSSRILKQNLEADVVVDLLLAASTVYKSEESDRVLQWFEVVAQAPSFALCKMLFTAEQIIALTDTLIPLDLRPEVHPRVNAVREAYGLPEERS